MFGGVCGVCPGIFTCVTHEPQKLITACIPWRPGIAAIELHSHISFFHVLGWRAVIKATPTRGESVILVMMMDTPMEAIDGCTRNSYAEYPVLLQHKKGIQSIETT